MTDRIDTREMNSDQTRPIGRVNAVDRYQGFKVHHHETWSDNVDQWQLDDMKKLMEDRTGRSRGVKKNRVRDKSRETLGGARKVRNPAWYKGICVVCWAAGKTRRVARYCKECSLDPEWKFKCRIGGCDRTNLSFLPIYV